MPSDELRGVLVISRHGHSLLNAEGRDSGRRDPSLTIRGAFHAVQLGKRLAPIGPDVWYASHLRRQWLTAAIAAGSVRIDPVPTRKQAADDKLLAAPYAGKILFDADGPIIHTTPHLMERSYGEWEGEKKNPEKKRSLGYFEAPPGGMSLAELEPDVRAVLELSAREHPDEIMVAITSNGWMRAAIGIQLDSPVDKDNVVETNFPHSLPFTLAGLLRYHRDLGTKSGPNLDDPTAYLVAEPGRP